MSQISTVTVPQIYSSLSHLAELHRCSYVDRMRTEIRQVYYSSFDHKPGDQDETQAGWEVAGAGGRQGGR